MSPCVGCSSAVIAFTTDIGPAAAQERSSAVASEVLATSMSSMPDSTRPVSSVVSPVFSWRSSGPKVTVCAPSRSAPVVKAVRVRVEVRRK